MRGIFWCAPAIAALLFPVLAAAQDITLTSREGNLSISGILQGFDGEFYRIDSAYGLLTVDASGVVCDGPACPDLTAPKIDLRVIGLPGMGQAVLPVLFESFARQRGLEYATEARGAGYSARLADGESGKTLAQISFEPAPADPARQALVAGRAEFMLSAAPEPGFAQRVVALDAMVAIVAPDNPLPRISTRDLARVLAGEVLNWQDLGGPDMPLVLHGLGPGDPLQAGLAARLGRDIAVMQEQADVTALAHAVARDPWAIAVTIKTAAGAARVLPLTDSCGFPLLPTPLAVKAEDYPLALPLHLVLPRRRLPLLAREFVDFLGTPAAQAAIAATGLVDRQTERQPMTSDGLRLINAIRGAGPETTLADLQALVAAMDGADRLSLTFRFQDGSSTLDAHSQTNLADLARLLDAGVLRGRDIVLAGFSDGSGEAAANARLSESRARGVLDALLRLLPDLAEADRPQVAGFGEALPMACDETAAGRRLNRRVEVWLRPVFTNSLGHEN